MDNVLSKRQFKKKWESDDDGGGITFEHIAACFTRWGLGAAPKTLPMDLVVFAVLKAAKTVDAADFDPDKGK